MRRSCAKAGPASVGHPAGIVLSLSWCHAVADLALVEPKVAQVELTTECLFI